MRSLARFTLCLFLSCGGSPSTLQAPATPSASGSPPVASLSAPNLSAVGDPAGLIVFGRISKAGASLATLRDWSKLPMPQPDEVTEFVTGESIGPLVDLDQPIEFALAVAGGGLQLETRIAVSVGLKDIDRAKATLANRFKLVPADNGSLLLQEAGHAARPNEDDEASDRHACELAPAFGAPTVRLVCGWSGDALSELGPWLTRTAPRLATTSDVHVELRTGPLRGTISGQKRLLGGVLASGLGGRLDLPGSRQLIASVIGDVIDFALDLDRVALDVHLTERAATAALSLRFAHTTSALARLAAAHPERSAPAPAIFWQMPGDADLAFFERGIDEAELSHGRDLLLHVADEVLADDGLKEADRKAILEAVGELTSTAALASASGLDLDAARKALSKERSRGDLSDPVLLQDVERASAEALLGWHLMVCEEPATRWTTALKDLAAALGRPSVATAYRAANAGVPPPALHLAPMPKAAVLPSGAQHYVLELPPFHVTSQNATAGATAKPKAAHAVGKPLAIHLFLVPDGARTWLGVGGSDVVVAKLALAMGTAGDKLASRGDLVPLKASSLGAAGFVSLRGILEDAWQNSPVSRGKALDEMTKLPAAGAAPMVFSATAGIDDKLPQATVTVDLPRPAIEDLVAAIQAHAF